MSHVATTSDKPKCGRSRGTERCVDDSRDVQCPYCGSWIELWIDPGSAGEMVQDCDVCCRPWRVVVYRDDESGAPTVSVERAQ